MKYLGRVIVIVFLLPKSLVWFPMAIGFTLFTECTFSWCMSELYHNTIASWQQANPFPDPYLYREGKQ